MKQHSHAARWTWLIRRELWENRAIWIVPGVIGVALTLAALFGRVDIAGLASSQENRAFGGMALFAFGFAFYAVMNVYASWYLLDCLHAERKDRSILFWKSLPISDTDSVLAKLCTGLIVIPVVYFIAADVSTLLIAFIVSVRARSGIGVALWQPDVWLQLQALWVYLIVTTAIWYLPFAGWLLAVSAWAVRAVLLWSVLPPLGLCLLEHWFFGTHALTTALVQRTVGYIPRAFHTLSISGWISALTDATGTTDSVWQVLDPVGFSSNLETWIGLGVGLALILVAIRIRRYPNR